MWNPLSCAMMNQKNLTLPWGSPRLVHIKTKHTLFQSISSLSGDLQFNQIDLGPPSICSDNNCLLASAFKVFHSAVTTLLACAFAVLTIAFQHAPLQDLLSTKICCQPLDDSPPDNVHCSSAPQGQQPPLGACFCAVSLSRDNPLSTCFCGVSLDSDHPLGLIFSVSTLAFPRTPLQDSFFCQASMRNWPHSCSSSLIPHHMLVTSCRTSAPVCSRWTTCLFLNP